MIITAAQNFRDVFSSKEINGNIKGIIIPIVQRDYAQGRNTPEVRRIRGRFLNVLFDAVVNDKPTTLDFIYGNIEDGKLIPLDGQQRLTTLFLLHYYVAMHERVAVEERAFLKNFTYKTRISSRDFCEHLMDFSPDFTQESLSEQIIDQAWFLLEWDNDPTVQAMLVMLDAIHNKFAFTSGVWEKLIGDAVTFYFLPLEQMGVTDELYIKMNSRGKPLSPFEHFKAELTLKMKEVDSIIAERIASKLDREWTDLLWPYRNSGTGESADEVTDDEFLRYIHFVSNIISYRNAALEIEDDFDMIEQQFSKSCPTAKENLLMLERWFDLWVWKNQQDQAQGMLNVSAFFGKYISRNEYQEGKILLEERDITDTIPDLFSECCKCYGRKNGLRPMFPLGRTILLYSFIIYLEHQDKITDQEFRRRLRIVNNLVRNSSNTLRSEFMKELLLQVDKIIIEGVVEQVKEGRARFQSKQMEEEAEKLLWTVQYPEKAECLFKLEDHKFLNGYVSAVGLDHIDWCNRLYSLFECDLSYVIKAMLSVGDFFEADGWRYQIGTANARTYVNVWRSMFSPNRNVEGLRAVLLQLLEKYDAFTDSILREVISKYLQLAREMPVRYYLVKYSSMLPDRFGKYYWRGHREYGRNSYKVIMMMTEWDFGRNYDIFLKTLFDIAGGEAVGLQQPNCYSFTEYNNGRKDRLIMAKQGLYLTLDDDVYSIYNEDGDKIDTRSIIQNENGIDIEDRVLVGLQLLNKYLHLYDEVIIRQFITRCDWTFAKTMPQYPHEYIVRGKCPLSNEEFEYFVWAQRTLGIYETWGAYRQPYLYIDGYKYWTMGAAVEETIIINRAKVN